MAEHFLDTETRYAVPLTALLCVQAELTQEAAEHIGTDEVVPAVGTNLLSVVGEWALWEKDWLVQRIEAKRHRSRVARAFSIFERLAAKPYWTAIAACMQALLHLDVSLREQYAHDLAQLGRIYWDMAQLGVVIDDPVACRLSALFPEAFERLFAPLLLKSERSEGRARIHAALGPYEPDRGPAGNVRPNP
jgi:hypothetical protein